MWADTPSNCVLRRGDVTSCGCWRASAEVESRWRVSRVCRCEAMRDMQSRRGPAPEPPRPPRAPRPSPLAPRRDSRLKHVKTYRSNPRSLSTSPFTYCLTISATRAQPFAHTCARTHAQTRRHARTHAHTTLFKHNAKNRIVLIYNRHSYTKNV